MSERPQSNAETRPLKPDSAGHEDAGLQSTASDEVLATSRLVLELIHAGYALEGAARDRRDAVAAVGHGGQPPRVSRHAIRASIELYQRGELTMGALAATLGMSPGWATRVVEELVTAGYAVRSIDPDDRRIVRIRLAPSAIAEAGAAYRWRTEVVEHALMGMAREERAAVRTFLSRLVERLADSGSV